ncbi:hypothetical protein D3C84_155060 [compost metagenome]
MERQQLARIPELVEKSKMQFFLLIQIKDMMDSLEIQFLVNGAILVQTVITRT